MGNLDTQGGGKYRTIEDGVITSVDGGNTFSIKVAGRDYDYVGVNGTWYDADNVEGEDVRIGFIQGSAKLPVLITRGSRPRRVIVSDNQVATVLEWLGTWGRLGGQQSAERAQSSTTFSPATITDLDEVTPNMFRSTKDYLYWALVEEGNLTVYRADVDGNITSTVYFGITGLGDLWTLLDEEQFIVSTGDKSLALLNWGVPTPVWSVDYTGLFAGEFWSDAKAYQDFSLLSLYVVPYRNNSASGWITVQAANGQFVADFPGDLIDPEPEFPTSNKYNADSPSFFLDDAFRVATSEFWDMEQNRDNWQRGLFWSGSIIIPALAYSDQVIGQSPEDGTILWSIQGWENFDQAGTAVGEVTTYERYTVVCCDDTRTLLFVCRFGWEKVEPARERVITYDDQAQYFMQQADIDDVEDNLDDAFVAEASFDAQWTFYSGSEPATFASDLVDAVHDAYDNGTDLEADEDEELVLSRLEYGYRVINSETGETISNWWLRDYDGASLDGTRSGASDAEKVEIPIGLPQVTKTTLGPYTRDDWDGGDGRPFQEWFPEEFAITPNLLEESGIDWRKAASKLHAVYHFTGKIHVPYDINATNKSPNPPPGSGDYYHLCPWDETLPFETYSNHHFITDDNLLSGIVDDETTTNLDAYDRHGFFLALEEETPTDFRDLEWLSEYTSVMVYLTGYDHATQEVPLVVDGAPRWDAVNASFVDGKVVFAPGHRNLSAVVDDGGIIVIIL